jgi:outer membrane receptor for ferrienterochelin and colicin
MIRSIAFVLATSAARDPVAALRDGVVPVATAPVAVHQEPWRSWTYTSEELDHYGARTLGDALRLTPGVVIGPTGQIFIQGTPLGDGSVMLDGVGLLGVPVASVP